MSKTALRPYLITKDADSRFRLTVRQTRYNSQGYPLVTSTMQEEAFTTLAAAKTHARDHFGAEAGQYATK